MKRAFITGITGQDGSYLAELLLGKGYEVHGMIRRSSSFNTQRIDHLYQDPHILGTRLFLHYGDLSDAGHLAKMMYEITPEEVYHLGAQSHVRVSFEVPEYTGDVVALGTIRLLEPSARPVSTRKCASIKPLPPNSMAWSKRFRRKRQPLFIRVHLTRLPSSTATGRPSTTAKRTACTPATASSSTTNPRAAARPS